MERPPCHAFLTLHGQCGSGVSWAHEGADPQCEQRTQAQLLIVTFQLFTFIIPFCILECEPKTFSEGKDTQSHTKCMET